MQHSTWDKARQQAEPAAVRLIVVVVSSMQTNKQASICWLLSV
jgi:hypothetical protein